MSDEKDQQAAGPPPTHEGADAGPPAGSELGSHDPAAAGGVPPVPPGPPWPPLPPESHLPPPEPSGLSRSGGRVRYWAARRPVQLVAAGLAGVIIGAIGVGAVQALTGEEHDHYPFARYGDGGPVMRGGPGWYRFREWEGGPGGDPGEGYGGPMPYGGPLLGCQMPVPNGGPDGGQNMKGQPCPMPRDFAQQPTPAPSTVVPPLPPVAPTPVPSKS